ncbi:hypothetical protein Y032_0290g1521 [Ancylostoma ceylanicum]|nr:hypothetical protein Y032_0290g1521 [Ancylostoma ceylanicum]
MLANLAMRELDREKSRMEMQEKKVIAEIKKMAKQNQMDSVKVMAKDLVRTRRYIKKFIIMKANIQAVSLKVQTLKSQDAMAQCIKNTSVPEPHSNLFLFVFVWALNGSVYFRQAFGN